MQVETFLVGSAIDCVVAQRLARKLCEKCRVAYAPEPGELLEAGFPESRLDDLGEFFRPHGCATCSSTGYRGRIGLYEVMPMSEEIERLTVDRAPAEAVKTAAIQQGMQTLRDDGLEKAASGVTSIEEIARVVR
jgi:type IV pilus assembly protein PilB